MSAPGPTALITKSDIIKFYRRQCDLFDFPWSFSVHGPVDGLFLVEFHGQLGEGMLWVTAGLNSREERRIQYGEDE